VNDDGHFRALLRYHIDGGDTVLENHIKIAGNNATYISKTSTNELIQCCGTEVLNIILKRITLAKFYCVIFDESTDVSHTSQLSLSIRYTFKNTIREDFVGFVSLHKSIYSQRDNDFSATEVESIITGKVLGTSVVKKLKNLGLDLLFGLGIGCDGCSVNLCVVCGAAKEITTVAKNALICLCLNHALNNTL